MDSTKKPSTTRVVAQKFDPCHLGSAADNCQSMEWSSEKESNFGQVIDRLSMVRISLISTLAITLHMEHLICLFATVVLGFEIGRLAGLWYNDASEVWQKVASRNSHTLPLSLTFQHCCFMRLPSFHFTVEYIFFLYSSCLLLHLVFYARLESTLSSKVDRSHPGNCNHRRLCSRPPLLSVGSVDRN